VGKIVTLVSGGGRLRGAVTLRVELQFKARPGGDDAQVVRGYFPSSSVICGD
jgi:hypothetical protein